MIQIKLKYFYNHFASIASHNPNIPLPRLPDIQLNTNTQFDSIETTELEVKRLLTQLGVHKSTRPDGIGNWILHHRSDSLCKRLTALFNKSLADGVFPRTWKRPVYKKGNKSDKVNYRPISLLSNMSKVLEKITNVNMNI